MGPQNLQPGGQHQNFTWPFNIFKDTDVISTMSCSKCPHPFRDQIMTSDFDPHKSMEVMIYLLQIFCDNGLYIRRHSQSLKRVFGFVSDI